LWAGVALGVLALKPQLAFLVPAALLFARHDRAFAGSLLALGSLAVISVIALGPAGIADYQSRLQFAAGVPVNRELTLAYFLRAGPAFAGRAQAPARAGCPSAAACPFPSADHASVN